MSDDDSGPPGTGDESNGGYHDGRQIDLLSEPYLVLEFSSSSTIRVRLVDERGEPVPDHAVYFSLHGRANDSSLSEIMGRSAEDGLASVIVSAGLVESTFSVRVAGEGFEPIHIAVTVSMGELAAITILPQLSDELHLSHYRAYILGEMSCGSGAIDLREYDRVATIPIGLRRLYFPFLPVYKDYAVAIEALDPRGDVLALICSEIVLDEPELIHRVSLDEGRASLGSHYSWSAEFAWEPHLGGLLAGLSGLVDPNADEAEALLDALLGALLEDELLVDHQAILGAKASLIPLVGGAIGEAGPRAPLKLVSARLEALSEGHLLGDLFINADEVGGALGAAEIRGVRFTYGGSCDEPDDDGCLPELPELPEPLSVYLDEPIEAPLTLEFTSARRAEFGLGLSTPELALGSLLPRYLVASFVQSGLLEEGEALEAIVLRSTNCEAFAALPGLLELLGDCDGACLLDVCEAQAAQLFDGLMAQLGEPASLALSGELRFVDASFLSRLMTRVVGAQLTLSVLAEGQPPSVGAAALFGELHVP